MKNTRSLVRALSTLVTVVACGSQALAQAAAPTSDPGAAFSQELAAVMHRNTAAMAACYTHALESNPGLAGRVVLAFRIAADGRVAERPTAQGMDEDPSFGACLADSVAALRFPAPPAGVAAVTYAFAFRP